jgi:O6-methylguanine-DNA--protein-cysteine methyltransferase
MLCSTSRSSRKKRHTRHETLPVDPKSVRCDRNPVSIIVPCHRVISSAGELTGYAGGLERKAGLLARERPAAALPRQLELLDAEGVQ